MDVAAVVYRALGVPALIKDKATAGADRLIELYGKDPDGRRPSRLVNSADAVCKAAIEYISEGLLDPVLAGYGDPGLQRHAIEIRSRAERVFPALSDETGDALALVVIDTMKQYVADHPDDDGTVPAHP